MGPYIHFKMYKVVAFALSFTVIAIYGFKLEANEPSTRKEGCIVPSWRGDNYCDDGNNNEGCDYDGGDCCGSNVNKTYCQNCECLDPNNGDLPPQCTNYNLMNDPKRRYDYVKKGERFCDKADGNSDSRPTSSDWVGSGWYRVTGQAGTSLSTHAYQWGGPSASNDGTCGTRYGSHVTGTHPSTVGQTGTMRVCFELNCNTIGTEHDIDVTNCGSFYVYKLPGINYCSWRYCTQ